MNFQGLTPEITVFNMISKTKNFNIDSLLVKNEKLRPKFIPGGEDNPQISIASLKEKDLALLHYLLIRFYDADDNKTLDAEEQNFLSFHVGAEITSEELVEMNESLWYRKCWLERLMEDLQSGVKERIISACETLATIKPPAKEAVPLLMELTAHADNQISSAAMSTIGKLGKIVKKYLPEVMAKFRSSDSKISDYASDLLMNLDAVAAPELLKIVKNSREKMDLRVKAAQLLVWMWFYDKELLNFLIKAYKEGSLDVKIKVIYSLGRIGVFNYKETAQLLKRAQKSKDKKLREAANDSLKTLDQTRKNEFKHIREK